MYRHKFIPVATTRISAVLTKPLSCSGGVYLWQIVVVASPGKRGFSVSDQIHDCFGNLELEGNNMYLSMLHLLKPYHLKSEGW